MPSPDSTTLAVEGCGVSVYNFIPNIQPLVDALPANSPQKHTLQLQIAEVGRRFKSASQRYEEVRSMVLDWIFDPACSVTAHHAAKFARLLERRLAYHTMAQPDGDGNGVSPALILHLATVVRSEPLQDPVSDPISQSWLFSQWCTLYSSLEPLDAIIMLETGMLHRLYGIDVLRMIEHKRQLLDRPDILDITTQTHNALSNMPRLLCLCDILQPAERNASAMTKVLDLLDAVAGPLSRALAKFSGEPIVAVGSGAEEQAKPDSNSVSINTAFELAKETRNFLPFCNSMEACLMKASGENDFDAIVAVGIQVNMMLQYIRVRELARI
ncbi:uncharacterized protein LMH87_007600 [Akanthomyces muscarius]|uniref:Uncharacterized protein n=1 Tax=Akanthomyces muscarius TaxID=2231603 RepID=A0A9W8QMV8_AKAMU|nr:uncharacterized protein LMH87_007600 [Akanthomyces muscarius]KAJ4161568.1 hypothetical protein LMH87_007600 [Akanthomyces muscarius]